MFKGFFIILESSKYIRILKKYCNIIPKVHVSIMTHMYEKSTQRCDTLLKIICYFVDMSLLSGIICASQLKKISVNVSRK